MEANKIMAELRALHPDGLWGIVKSRPKSDPYYAMAVQVLREQGAWGNGPQAPEPVSTPVTPAPKFAPPGGIAGLSSPILAAATGGTVAPSSVGLGQPAVAPAAPTPTVSAAEPESWWRRAATAVGSAAQSAVNYMGSALDPAFHASLSSPENPVNRAASGISGLYSTGPGPVANAGTNAGALIAGQKPSINSFGPGTYSPRPQSASGNSLGPDTYGAPPAPRSEPVPAPPAAPARPQSPSINSFGPDTYGENQWSKGDGEGEDWGMPLMMAGLAMMASKNPSFFGALGEGGMAGVGTLLGERKRKRDDTREDRRDALAERSAEADIGYKKNLGDHYNTLEQFRYLDAAREAMKPQDTPGKLAGVEVDAAKARIEVLKTIITEGAPEERDAALKELSGIQKQLGSYAGTGISGLPSAGTPSNNVVPGGAAPGESQVMEAAQRLLASGKSKADVIASIQRLFQIDLTGKL